MSGPGRNDPCPCGSGKKYKKCCLGREAPVKPAYEALGPAEKALVWIHDAFPGELGAAVAEGFFADWEKERLEQIRELDEGLQEMVWTNANEWALAEGLDSEGRRFIDAVLGDGGPPLTAEDRRFLQALASTPLDVYEVVGVEPGEGITLLSKTDPKAKPVPVLERTASRTLREGDYFGARVLRLGSAVLSGAVYPFAPESYLRLRAEIFRDGRRKRPEPELVTFSMIDLWLSTLVAPAPRITDASTGEPVVLTTVHYEVRDLDALSRALAAEPDVEREEDGWVRLEDPGSSAPRLCCTLSMNDRGRLEVFARTGAAADEAEAWLAELAGDAVRRIAREVVDPRHLWKKGRESESSPPRPNEVMDSLSPEQRTELTQGMYEQVYANWADEPVPFLKGKTPRQAVRSKSGRREVFELLRVYERDERRRAESEGRAPADLGFLRKELGLEDV